MLLVAAAVSSCAGGGVTDVEEALFTKIGRHVLPKSRMVELNCVVTVTGIPENAKEIRLWVPYPAGDGVQRASERTVEHPADYRPMVRYDGRNSPYFFVSGERPLPKEFKVEYTLKVRRDELDQHDLDARVPTKLPYEMKDLAPLGDVDRAGLRKIVDGLSYPDNVPLGKARAVFNWVVEKLEYDVSAEGVGTGSVRNALTTGRGTYVDYAMVTTALLRAADIPARIEAGYQLPQHRRPERTPLAEQAAWVSFYDGKAGWICADPCMADRYPELADYMFAGLCANRIRLTTGAGPTLEPKPETPVPVPFVRAFAESGKKPVTVETRFFFRDTGADENWGTQP